MTQQKKKRANPALARRQRQGWVRVGVQIVFFLAAPSVYASAFSGLKAIFTAFGAGEPLAWSAFTTHLVLLTAFTVLFGRYFCGWACAFGAVGDWIYRFSQWAQKKTKVKLPALPEKAVLVLQWMKYVTLAVVLALCFLGFSGAVSRNSPWTVFSMVISGNLRLAAYGVAIVFLLTILVGMALQERYFCQFFCPMGAVFSLLPVLPFFNLKRNAAACPARCGACRKNCPVSLQLDRDSLRQGECIRCGRCSGICPRGNISTAFGLLKGDEIWPDLLRGAVLLALMLVL
ncbi:MAG: 4Fe-4S binding protein [Clostridiales bacterium]|nr:4Fe-4S binding protein [Clostridiales bacterium]